MKPDIFKHLSRKPHILSITLLVFCLKLFLAVGYYVLESSEDVRSSIFSSEVLAQDRKGNPGASSGQETPEASTQGTSLHGSSQVNLSHLPDAFSYLQQREADLKRKEEQLSEKEEYLAQMEKEIEKKLNELISMQKEIQAYRTEKEEDESARVRSLVRIYESMKPKEAAKLLENLEDDLVVNIIATMNPSEAASVLTNMEVKKAAKISQALTSR